MSSGIFEITFLLILLLNLYVPISGEELDESEDGSFLFSSVNEEFCEDEVKQSLKREESRCNDENLLSFLSSLQIINPESVIALATKNKLHKVCANTSRTIKHMETYLKSCTLQPDQETYHHLLKGISTLNKKLCTNDPYQKAFMKFKDCYRQLQSELDSCNGPADWSDNSNTKKVCKAYQDIVDCYYIKTSVLCGNKAAEVFKELVNAVVESVITVDCTTTVGSLAKANKNMSHQQSGSMSHSFPDDLYFTMFVLIIVPQIDHLLNVYKIFFIFYW